MRKFNTKTAKIIATILSIAIVVSCVFVPGVSAASLGTKEYVCDFEEYVSPQNAISYDGNKISIVEEEGSDPLNHIMQTTQNFVAGTKTAFEPRNTATFPVEAGKSYTVTFDYKATASLDVAVGMAKTANVPASAYSISKRTLASAAEWTNVSYTLTLDKSATDGYSLAILLFNGDSSNKVSFDNIKVIDTAYYVTNMPAISFSEDWYPGFKENAAPPTVEEPIQIWDGSTKTQPEGTGEESDPYLITNGAELAWAILGQAERETVSYYKLTKDIYLNDIAAADWSTGTAVGGANLNKWVVSNNAKFNFQGHIDGDGHMVYGLYAYGNAPGVNPGEYGATYTTALIPRVTPGGTVSVKNLGIDYAFTREEATVGAIIGSVGYSSAATATVEGCYVGPNVKLMGTGTGAIVGHISKADSAVTITNCYSFADITNGWSGYNGLVGYVNSATVTVSNSYNAKGTVFGLKGTATASNCYQTGTSTVEGVTNLKALQMQGLNVLNAAMSGLAGTFVATETYPVLEKFGVTIEDPDSAIWDGSTKVQPFGAGTSESDPYLISTSAELAWAILDQNTRGTVSYYKLVKDIYLNDIEGVDWMTGTAVDSYSKKNWSKVNFQGHIDGDGHMIYGLYANDGSTSYTPGYAAYGYTRGLIADIPDGGVVTLKNIGIDYAYIRCECGASPFIGTVTQGRTVTVNMSNCFVGASVKSDGDNSGAFMGFASGGTTATLTNCYSLANIVARNNQAGLVGFIYWPGVVNINNCYNANGKLVGAEPTSGTVTASYETVDSPNVAATAILTADNMQGKDVFTAGKMAELNSGNAYVATNTYPVLLKFYDGPIEDTTEPEQPEEPEEQGIVIWDGSETAPAKGNGEEATPYEISNGAELAYIIANGGGAGKYYKVTADIYLNDIEKINWTDGTAIGSYTPNVWNYEDIAFQGNLDGNGYTVYGLYFKSSLTPSWGLYGIGLIPRVSAGTNLNLSKLGVDYAYVKGAHGTSAFVGMAGTSGGDTANKAQVNIDQCYVGENVTLYGADTGAFRGAGYASNTVVTNCYSLATISGSGGFIGLVGGEIWGTSVNISKSFNAKGAVNNAGWASGFAVSSNVYVTVTSEYDICTTVTADNMKGLDALTNDSKMSKLNADDVFIATEGYPMLKAFIKAPAEEETVIEIWDGTTKTQPKGAGTSEEDPYLITNGAELAWAILGHRDRDSGANVEYFKLTNDIYLNDITKINWETGHKKADYSVNKWTVSGTWGPTSNFSFQGHIDGAGFTVYGLYCDDQKAGSAVAGVSYGNGTAAGLIPKVTNGGAVTLKNLGVDNAFVRWECAGSALVGSVAGTASLDMNLCYTGDNVTVISPGAGGLLGYAGGTANVIVANSYSLANLTGGNKGLIAYVAGGTVGITGSYNGKGNVFGTKGSATASSCYGTDTLTVAEMTGADALENMSGLSTDVFEVRTRTFADYNYYTYLPAGTEIGGDYKLSFYDTAFAPIDAEAVMAGNVMVRGAYVKFDKNPTVTDIVAPADMPIYQGTVAELQNTVGYYGIEAELVNRNLGDETVNYIFISDIHFNGADSITGQALLNQMKLLVKLANSEGSKIDFIALGGDLVEVNTKAKTSYINNLKTLLTPLTESTKPVFVLNGNHDDNATYALNDASYEEYANRIVNVRDWNNLLTELGINSGYKGVEDKKYFYYDLADKKTRVICLNASDYPQEFDGEGNVIFTLKNTAYTSGAISAETYYNALNYVGYSDEQLDWLENTALTADSQWNYIFLSHMGIDTTECGDLNYSDTGEVIGAERLTALVNENKSQVSAWHFGHVHAEYDYFRQSANLWHLTSDTAKPTADRLGNENEASFDVVSVRRDYVNKQNVGSGNDGVYYAATVIETGDVNADCRVDILDLVQSIEIAENRMESIAECSEASIMAIRHKIIGREDNDGNFKYETVQWEGPDGYVIVVPDGNTANTKSAELLQSYYANLGFNLNIVTDETPETAKEILVGTTNRSQSDTEISEADLSVSIKDDKLCFDGGHNVTVDSAVKKFLRLAPRAGEAVTFSLTTDFTSALSSSYVNTVNLEGYSYTWGDEFESDGLDSDKWTKSTKMAGNDKVHVAYDNDVVNVSDGRLKLTALSYFNEATNSIEYKVPGSVITEDKMNFTYGYMEIRARVPYKQGVWASWWTQSTGALKPGGATSTSMLEVDIYEIFNTNQKTSNLIQWVPGAEPNTWSGPALYPNVNSNPQAYKFDVTPSLSYEYHTYGYYWSPTEIKMYIDGVEHFTYDITKVWCDKTDDLTMYHDPQHIIFNNHLFYPGVSTASQSITTAPESLPAEHCIDYIRLYQKTGEGELYLAE